MTTAMAKRMSRVWGTISVKLYVSGVMTSPFSYAAPIYTGYCAVFTGGNFKIVKTTFCGVKCSKDLTLPYCSRIISG